MKTVYDNYGDDVSLHDICYLIYQAFGQSIVESFALSLEKYGEEITWGACAPCEDQTPFYQSLCLVCSTAQDEDDLIEDMVHQAERIAEGK